MQDKTFHIILLEKNGYKYSLWLPNEKEGKYEFTGNGVTLPIYIVGENNSWYVVASGEIITNGVKMQENYCILDRQSFMEINTNNSVYLLYVEDMSDAGRIYLPYVFPSDSEVIIGRENNCDIVYPNPRVSRNHLKIYKKYEKWYVKDLESMNGTYLNNKLVTENELKPGDVIFVMGLNIICGIDYFAMNNADQKAYVNLGKVKPIYSESEAETAEIEEIDSDEYFERSPRSAYKIIPKKIEIEAPPMSMKGGKVPLLLRMGNSLVFGGSALMSGNILMATTSLFLPGITQGLTEKERKDYEEKRVELYKYYLEEKEKEILKEKKREEEKLKQVYPELIEVLGFAKHKDRLWERRKFDEDYLKIRIGYSNLPLMAEIKYPPKQIEVERDDLSQKMYELVEKKNYLDKAPVLISLSEDYFIGVKGNIRNKIAFIRNLILQLAFTHSYDEVKIALVGKKSNLKELEFVKYLPHNWSNDKDIRFYAESRADVQQLATFLNKVLEDHGSNNKSKIISKFPSYVVIVFDKELYDYIEAFKVVCDKGEYCGISLLAAFDNMPKECSKLFCLGPDNQLIDLYEPENGVIDFKLDDYRPDLAKKSIDIVNRTRLRLDEKNYSLPTNVDFLEMYGINNVEHLNPLKRWTENDPTKSLATPIGIGCDGKQFLLDLHEKKQGPHGLIAGGTGSGKSEFIISYILSMAINYSPDEVAFILIDYKGGGLADAFVDKKKGIYLPHVVGTITNLDGASINRSLLSINSELKRRQTVFKNAKSATEEGTMDIYDYQKLYRLGKVSEPMPHLFIISDEFAELKKQQPEFMDELISTARIGRSLGVHLILATQKPSGVVNDQIWSNTKFRVCLKVASKSDSQEMLKRPEAAEIKNTGRFYLQVGYNDFFAMGQAGWCGAGYFPGESKVSDIDEKIEFVDNVGQDIFIAKPTTQKKQAECKQVVAIVKYLSEIAQKEGIAAKQLWCDPLPDDLDLEWVLNGDFSEVDDIVAPIGMFDDPENQLQFKFTLNMMDFHHMMVVGPSGSGKSVFVRSLLYSLVSRYSPEDVNYYLVDFSRGALKEFSKMQHCGAYITENDERDYARLLNLIADIAADRKQKFLEERVTTFEGYRKIKNMPLIIFVIDGYSTLKAFKKGNDYHVALSEYMKLGSSYGIRFIITLERFNEVYSRAKQEADYNVMFQGKDKYEYMEVLGRKCYVVSPIKSGRGVAVYGERPLEFHTAMLDAGFNEFERAEGLKQRLDWLREYWSNYSRAESLPMVTSGEMYDTFLSYFDKYRIPIGYSLRDLRRVAMPLKQFHSLSVYIGNPAASYPFIENMLCVAKKNEMRVVFMKKTINSFMDVEEHMAKYSDVECMQVSEAEIVTLSDIIQEELLARNVYRDAYCKEHNIPKDFNGKAVAAKDYIMENTKPFLVFFEAFGDLCRLDETDTMKVLMGHFEIFFGRTKGYNMYFIGVTYPEDTEISRSMFMRSFNPDQFCLLMGGRYDKQCIAMSLPSEIKRETKVKSNYDEMYMKYRDEYYAMKMPMGELVNAEENEDEASIV